MKKMISVALLTSFMAMSPVVFAATSQEETKTEASKELSLNKFKDNWMISIEGGANYSMGYQDSQADFGELVAPVFGINVEKWFAPAMGLRLGVDYYGFKGSAELSATGLEAHGLSGEEIKSGKGYKQSFEMIYPALDVMSDLASLFCGYRDRVYSPILYVGAGLPVAICGDGKIATWPNFGLRAGFMNRFRLAEGWALNLDIRFDALESRVTNEVNKHGHQLSALLGVTYKFKGRGWNAPVIPAPVVITGKYSDAEGDALVAQLRDANRKIADLEQQLADCKNRPVESGAADVNPTVTVYYNINSSEIQAKDRNVLKAVAKAIQANEGAKYVVTGYADSETGTAEFNAKLRKARAERVYNALIAYGVSPDQLEQATSDEKLDRFGSYVLDRAATISAK